MKTFSDIVDEVLNELKQSQAQTVKDFDSDIFVSVSCEDGTCQVSMDLNSYNEDKNFSFSSSAEGETLDECYLQLLSELAEANAADKKDDYYEHYSQLSNEELEDIVSQGIAAERILEEREDEPEATTEEVGEAINSFLEWFDKFSN